MEGRTPISVAIRRCGFLGRRSTYTEYASACLLAAPSLACF